MQIKRFEADDMTEALRLVKKELGDDAVILSAKEVRTKGFFSALRKKRVEITAATDYPSDAPSDNPNFPDILSSQLDNEEPVDQVSLSNRPPSVRQIKSLHQPRQTDDDSTGLSKVFQRPASRNLADTTLESINGTVKKHTGRYPTRQRLAEASPNSQWTAEPFYKDRSNRRRVIALVGPSGSGKSATVAKLARYCRIEEGLDVAIVSLDRFRIGANAMLDRVARNMGRPLVVVRDGDALHACLDDMGGVDVVLIDTPGVNHTEHCLMAQVESLIGESAADEIHLVVNATLRERILMDQIDRFTPLGIDRLLFTHMDEYGCDMTIAHILSRTRLPVSFYTHGTDLFDHLQECKGEGLADFLPSNEDSGPRAASPQRIYSKTAESQPIAMNAAGHAEVQYVANRNSELFHLPACKSVKRINVENITAFESAAQAIEAGFRPCRACCRADTTGPAKKVAWAAL
ncbi:MAG: hypothetical protein CSA23_05615 [Deltaproteobacteria bacterium]|nr:MAG: hypothetical protein CSA23_05615 [Deltaproteobacteria bacterium]